MMEFPALYSTEAIKAEDKLVAQIWTVAGRLWWFIVEKDPASPLAFGFANLADDDNEEWGYIDMDELKSVAVPWGESGLTFKEAYSRAMRTRERLWGF